MAQMALMQTSPLNAAASVCEDSSSRPQPPADLIPIEERRRRSRQIYSLLRACENKFDVAIYPVKSVVFVSSDHNPCALRRIEISSSCAYTPVSSHKPIEDALRYCSRVASDGVVEFHKTLVSMFDGIRDQLEAASPEISAVRPSREEHKNSTSALILYVEYLMRACEICFISSKNHGVLYAFGIVVTVLHHFSTELVAARQKNMKEYYLVFFETCMRMILELTKEVIIGSSVVLDKARKRGMVNAAKVYERCEQETTRHAAFLRALKQRQNDSIREQAELIMTFGSIEQHCWTTEEQNKFNILERSQRDTLEQLVMEEARIRKTVEKAITEFKKLHCMPIDKVDDEHSLLVGNVRRRMEAIKKYAVTQLQDKKNRYEQDMRNRERAQMAEERRLRLSAAKAKRKYDHAKLAARQERESKRSRQSHSEDQALFVPAETMCIKMPRDSEELTRPLREGEIRVRTLSAEAPRPRWRLTTNIEIGSLWRGTFLGLIEPDSSIPSSTRALEVDTIYPASMATRLKRDDSNSFMEAVATPPDSGLSRTASSCDASPAVHCAEDEVEGDTMKSQCAPVVLGTVSEGTAFQFMENHWTEEFCDTLQLPLPTDHCLLDEGFDVDTMFLLEQA